MSSWLTEHRSWLHFNDVISIRNRYLSLFHTGSQAWFPFGIATTSTSLAIFCVAQKPGIC